MEESERVAEVKTKSIAFPKSSNKKQETNTIETEASIVVVGANGSGKTRLGTWIEFRSAEKNKVFRISAQKSLSIPYSIRPDSLDRAEKMLYFGFYNETRSTSVEAYYDNKRGNRWGNQPETYLLTRLLYFES